MKIDPGDYQLLFRVANFKSTCLVSDFLIRGSLNLADPLAVNHQGSWLFYIKKEKLQLLERRGYSLFKSKSKFDNYSNNFRKYISYTRDNILRTYNKIPKKLEKSDFVDLVRHLQKFWYYYGLTEYVYHDYAYNHASKIEDVITLHNLELLGDLKAEGRKIWDSYVPDGGLVLNILTYFSEKYLYHPDDAKYLFTSELIKLFDDYVPSKKFIQQRKEGYAVYKIKGNIYHPTYTNALIVSKTFFQHEQNIASGQSDVIKGTIANKGKVTAKAIITPMYNIKDAIKISKTMEKGSVIVAQSTNPDLTVLLNKAGAIVTDQGGMLSHAAIVAREMNIPCIVGTRNATKIFKTGDVIEVDAYNGIVRRIE